MSIYESLLKAQKAFPPIVKNATNPHLKNKYADLGAVLDCVLPTLHHHGLALVVSVELEPLRVQVSVFNEKGEHVNFGAVPVLNPKGTAQDMGSGLTYARRYAIATAFNLFADDDDDGTAASQKQSPQTKVGVKSTHKEVVMGWVKAKLNEGFTKTQLKEHLGSLEGLDENGYKNLIPKLGVPLKKD